MNDFWPHTSYICSDNVPHRGGGRCRVIILKWSWGVKGVDGNGVVVGVVAHGGRARSVGGMEGAMHFGVCKFLCLGYCMLEKGKRNKNGTNNIGIQAFDAILQLGVGYWLIAQLLSHDVWGRS